MAELSKYLANFARNLDEARCVHDAIVNAVTKLNQHALSAVYAAKSNTPAPGTLVSQSHWRLR
jgi:hypothetical protein